MKVSILGDICPSYGYAIGNADSLLADIHNQIKTADFALCNLEEPCSDGGKRISKCGQNLRADSKWLEKLQEMGISAISMANNHIMDWGPDALLDTLNLANDLGMPAFGAGMSSESAGKPFYKELEGLRLGFLSFAEEEFNCAEDYGAGAHLFDSYTAFDEIRAAKARCDYLIILYHGGIEHYKLPSPLLQKKCRKMAECGADLVLCQHSHCIGTIEEYEGSTILYGQGNAVFSYRPGNEQWNTGLLLNLEFVDSREPKISFRLIEATEKGIVLADEKKTSERVARMYKESERLNDPDFIKKEWDKFCEKQAAAYYPMLFAWNRVFNKLNRLFGNKLVNFFISRGRKRATMNLLRCAAHYEVCKTILENEYWNGNK